MTNTSLSISVKSGNIFYQNFNVNENFYSLFTARQNKKPSFEKYINKYLPSFSMDDAEKFDLFANKNYKYLFYKFNDQIKALGGEKQIIRHTAKLKDSISLEKIEETQVVFLLKKIIHSIEFSNLYENSAEKKQTLLKLLKVIIRYPGEFTRLFLLILLTFLLNTFIT